MSYRNTRLSAALGFLCGKKGSALRSVGSAGLFPLRGGTWGTLVPPASHVLRAVFRQGLRVELRLIAGLIFQCLPDETGNLPGHGDGGFVAAHAAAQEWGEAAVEAILGFPT